ncbi:MAG: heme lyase CcmF/NrfE family subunit [Chloroflexota bacterium]
MIADFGYGILVVSLVVSLYSVGAAVVGVINKSSTLVESARRGMLLTWPLISVSALALIYLLVNDHYEISFVYEVTSRSMPTYLKITAWWGGQAGSLVFWSWLMSAFASLVTLRKWDRDREFLPWVIVVSSTTLAFFLLMSVAFENPFARLYQTPIGIDAYTLAPADSVVFTPQDGRGLNPLLRHPGMIIHPPMLYLGFVSFVIPFAFAMAALITGRSDDRWIRITRRWTLWAWLFLSLGLVLGGRWAYDVLGWGGYWGWDPVEIAAFMPWLTGTAFLHSVMIQEKRGLFKQWNMILIILTYALVIFGTFLTRSGVLSSVHAFASSPIGPFFMTFVALTLIASLALLIWRWPELGSETEMKSMLSREALFLLNNLLFMSVLVICFVGVIYPLVSELATGSKVTVGPPWYEFSTSPLFAMLMFLMAIAPLSSWGLSSQEKLSNINKPVLGGLLAAPVVVYAIFWKQLDLMIGSWPGVVISLAIVLVVLTLMYLFRKTLWQAALIASALTVYLAFTYTSNLIALIGFFLIALVILVTLREFWRAVRARQHAQQENFALALGRLIGRNRRRYGGYIIHVSMMLMAIGILGIEMFQKETQGLMAVGDSLNVAGYTVEYKELASWDMPEDGVNYTRAVVDVYKDGEYLGELHPRKDFYFDSQQSMTIPGQRPTFEDDLYVLLVDWQPATASGATFKIYVNPLVNWLWVGSLLFFVGVLIAAWPEKEAEYAAVRARNKAYQPSSAD